VRTTTIVMIACAILFGGLAVIVARAWLNHQAELRVNAEPPRPSVATKTIVVATTPLRYGATVGAQALREVAWPEGAIPAGTFASINELVADGKRIVLSSIEPNEPVLRSKITGPGQKATLSAVIRDGMKAVTVRVNDVEGVAGFVLPGDHVDVLMTRQSDKAAGTTDVVLQNLRVLAVDQMADDSTDRPTVAKAVTLEVETADAQKLSLAGSIGALSLALRKAGELNVQNTRRIGVTDLSQSDAPAAADGPKRFTTILVTRGSKTADQKTQEYSVPTERPDWREASGDGHRPQR
jgi:pilus assembly protein CpaB